MEDRRTVVKEDGDAILCGVVKIITNSVYGVIAFSQYLSYSPMRSSTITATGNVGDARCLYPYRWLMVTPLVLPFLNVCRNLTSLIQYVACFFHRFLGRVLT